MSLSNFFVIHYNGQMGFGGKRMMGGQTCQHHFLEPPGGLQVRHAFKSNKKDRLYKPPFCERLLRMLRTDLLLRSATSRFPCFFLSSSARGEPFGSTVVGRFVSFRSLLNSSCASRCVSSLTCCVGFGVICFTLTALPKGV